MNLQRGIDVGAKVEIYHIMNQLVAQGVGNHDIVRASGGLGMSDQILVMREGEMVKGTGTKEATQEKVMYYATGGKKNGKVEEN